MSPSVMAPARAVSTTPFVPAFSSVTEIDPPTTVREQFETRDFCAGYVNFYVCNGAVIAPKFGDTRADGLATEKLAGLFPDREIVMLNIDGIAAGGGGIHCATQQEPGVE